MRTKMLMAIGLLCLGCQMDPKIPASLDAPGTAPPCRGAGAGNNRDDCTIFIVVNESGSACSVDAPPSQRSVVFARDGKDKWLLWRFDANSAPGYKFTRTPDGIVFKRDPLNNFKNCNATGGGDGFHCKNRNGAFDKGDFPYGISVENTAKNIRCTYDPLIRNE